MKTINKLIICLVIVCLVADVLTKTHKNKKTHKSHFTPKGTDLRNHFGGSFVGSPYGPETSYESHVENNPEIYTPMRYQKWKNIEKTLEFTPFPGYENKLNPHQVKSGDFTNIAPSAQGLINPQITGPKMHVQTEMNYPSHVKKPTFYGFRKEFHPVTAYDREEGRIIHDNVIVNKPQYGFEDRVENIKRHVDHFVNLNTGETIEQNNAVALHGIERPEPEVKCNHGTEKKRKLRRF